jgi:hypothetical protein
LWKAEKKIAQKYISKRLLVTHRRMSEMEVRKVDILTLLADAKRGGRIQF